MPDAQWNEDRTLLELTAGTHFLGTPRYGSKLMVRSCYNALHDMIETHFQTGGGGFAVVGNSGASSCV